MGRCCRQHLRRHRAGGAPVLVRDRDKAWLEAIGFPLAKGVAEFYAKRAVSRSYRVTTAKPAGGASYDINDVMGPDECT